MAELDVDIIAPGLTELIALEVRGTVPTAYLELFELLTGEVVARCRCRLVRGRVG